MLEIFKSLKINRQSAVPLYMQLYETLRNMVSDGVLLPDTRLPSVRRMAEMLGVNQVTVVSAFKRLENEEFIYKKPGSGTYTADTTIRPAGGNAGTLQSLQDEVYMQDDFPLTGIGLVNIGENTINFASASPAPDLFPVDNFKIVMNEVLDRDRGNAFSYQESKGYYPLRESIVKLLRKSGLMYGTEDIHVISGAQQGIDIITKAVIRHGDSIVTESPTYTGAVAVFRSRDADIHDVQMEADGPDLDILEYTIKKHRPRFMYTIPSFQNPTGYSYSNDKRKSLLSLAEKYDFYIIEDDYVSGLDFSNRNYTPLKALDKIDRVIFVKSFSKIFMPGLRLGFMIVPAGLSDNLLAAKHTTDISTSGLIQRAFDLYIRKGFWDRHFNFMFNTYRERYAAVISSLDNYLPEGCSYLKPGGGLNIWLGLPFGFPVNSLTGSAAANDIAFAPGRIFYGGSAPQTANNIRLSYAAVYTDKIEAGIDKLCSLVRRLQNRGGSTKVPIL